MYKKNPAFFSMIFTEIHVSEDMTGWKLAREVRKFEEENKLPRTPIFAVTKEHFDDTGVDLDAEDKEERSSNLCHSEAAGMDGYMMKPPSRYKLRTLLANYINAKKSSPNPQSGAMTEAIHSGHGPDWDENFDLALAEFYTKEQHWLPRLLFLPALITRKFMKWFWWTLRCYGYTFGKAVRDDSKDVLIF
uniref:Response regulatory domain-containing protein n=1 Tax=Pyramimonas obovata TaxID=1411642 RepID=A0A7S0MW30_9CHLO|mmetsp:Transcript_13922/g.29748  ORF Transcript_13922/g.29748 Transcript_13922/m.29748 type:complete len:190 (+) Transcript_13922:303-872(+)